MVKHYMGLLAAHNFSPISPFPSFQQVACCLQWTQAVAISFQPRPFGMNMDNCAKAVCFFNASSFIPAAFLSTFTTIFCTLATSVNLSPFPALLLPIQLLPIHGLGLSRPSLLLHF